MFVVIKFGLMVVLGWQVDRLKGKGLLQNVDWTSGTISVHDLYMEFAVLESEGKLDESTDLENRRWVSIRNGDITELERRPSGGCWQKLSRLCIEGEVWNQRAKNRILCLEGVEWQFCSNVVVLELRGLDHGTGMAELGGPEVLEKPGVKWGS